LPEPRLLFCACGRRRGALGPLLNLAKRAPSRERKEKRHRKAAKSRNGSGYQLQESPYATRSASSWHCWHICEPCRQETADDSYRSLLAIEQIADCFAE